MATFDEVVAKATEVLAALWEHTGAPGTPGPATTVYLFRWTSDTSPADLKLNSTWGEGSGVMRLSEHDIYGQRIPWLLISSASSPVTFRLSTLSRFSVATGLLDGDDMDLGTYRSVPILTDEVDGDAPVENELVALVLGWEW